MCAPERRQPGRAPRVAPNLASGLTVGILLLAMVPAATAQGILEGLRRGMRAQEAFTRGKALYDAGGYTEAAEQLSRALTLDPGYDEARALLGWSQYRLGHYRAAIITFKSTIRRRPDWEGPLAGLGWSRLRLGRYHLATEAFQGALDRAPAYVDALIGVGTAQFELARYDAALPPLREALRRLTPLLGSEPADLPEVRAKVAWSLYYLERYSEALALFEEGIGANPGWHGLHNGAGWCYLKLGNRVRARAAFQQALRLRPNYPDALEGLRQASG